MSGVELQLARCRSTAVSWLVLEQHALDELSAVQRQEVDVHLERCEACRACLGQIRADAAALPELQLPRATRARWWRRRRWGVGLTAAAVAAATAALLVVSLPREALDPHGDLPPARISFKGGELSLALVRLRGGEVQHAPTIFTARDRFKAEVTCAPGRRLVGDLIVYQGRERSFPLTPAAPLSCGNRAPLAGAFRITGAAPVIICLVVEQGNRPLDRAALRRSGPGALPRGRSVCLRLTHAR